MDYYSLFREFSRKKVLVVGDIMLDHYIFGDSVRISPEAPVPVVNFQKEQFSAGGAANVALNLDKLGTSVWIIGKTGNGNLDAKLISLIEGKRINRDNILRQSGYQSPVKTRIISGQQQIVRIDRENVKNNTRQFEQRIRDYFDHLTESYNPDLVVLSDYNKGLISEELSYHLINTANKQSIPVTVDPKGKDWTKYKGATAITPNMKEAEQVCQQRITDDRSLKNALKDIACKTGIKNVLITRGGKGTSYLDGNKLITVPTDAKDVYDVTGAGDTFISVFSLAYITTGHLEFSVRLANTASALVVGKMGTYSPGPDEIINECRGNSNKLLTNESLNSVIDDLRSTGMDIVFTNGCFDLFHSGHLHLLEESKKLGDVLIVALNTDESVRRLKGESRPVIKESDRISILSALECVDYVVIFGEDTPIDLIKKIRPDVITKGGDYKKTDIVGAREVKEYGGRVETVSLKEKISTSGLLKRIDDRRIR